MREIKFRAWDKVCREMFYNSELANGDMMVICLDGEIQLSDDDTYKPDDFILMQYTGLKDKNGKEIYEGDVLHCDGFWNLYAVWDEENARFAFLCTDWVVTQGHPIQPNISSYCIIGNIYENPELLGVNK